MNIGFFGGSFDPPHKGHINAADVFCKEADLSVLYIIPTHVSPFKKNKTDVCSDKDRLKMCELAFFGIAQNKTTIFISDIETKRSGTSYTVDTIKELCTLHPDDTIFMYVGSDMFLALERWKDIETIFEKCVIYTRARYEGELQNLKKCSDSYIEKYGARVIISNDKELVCSSTDVRTFLMNNDSFNVKKMLTDDVLGYIIKNKLYLKENANEE